MGRLSRSGRIVVIGGGVIGVTTAVSLARRGAQVMLIERANSLAEGASARNGGQLSYCYTDALPTASLLRDLPRLAAGLDPAFRIHANASPRFLGWIARFLMNCTASRWAANTLAVLRLALQSRAAMAMLRQRHPALEFKHSASGKVHLYDDPAKLLGARSAMQIKSPFGCEQRILSFDELIAIEPALAASRPGIVGAVYSPLDEAGDSCQFTQTLAALSSREDGLDVRTGVTASSFVVEKRSVRALRTSAGEIEADRFVLAAGCASPALARTAGFTLPVHPMKGYSITLPATRDSPVVSITDTRAKIVFCRLQDEVRIAGMAELGGASLKVDRRRIDVLLQAARACLPKAADWSAPPAAWSGLRPMTPDSRPIVSATRLTNLFVNCGHGMLGWTLACGSAELAADLVLQPTPAADARSNALDFSLARF